jgi:hypothetical protein
MERDELERWLLDGEADSLSPFDIAEALGLPAEALMDTTLLRAEPRVRSLRFTLAVLEDAFASDIDLWRWLETPRHELGGMTARAALVTRLERQVEALAVRAWNAQSFMAGAA